MSGGGSAGGVPISTPEATGQQSSAGSLGFSPGPAGPNTLAETYSRAGGIGGGMGAADYNPSAAPGGSGLFSGGQSAPGQMNMQLTNAQKTNLLAQQQMRDQMVRQQPAPQQMQQQRAMSPLVQQQMMRQQQPMFNPMQQQMMARQNAYPQQMGLQAALMQMMGRYNQPMQRQQFMPPYQAPQYRPNMSQAQQSLGRVKPSVQKQAQDAQAARISELEAQLAGYQTPTNDYGGAG